MTGAGPDGPAGGRRFRPWSADNREVAARTGSRSRLSTVTFPSHNKDGARKAPAQLIIASENRRVAAAYPKCCQTTPRRGAPGGSLEGLASRFKYCGDETVQIARRCAKRRTALSAR